MLNIILFGPPGAGKGTQSENLIREFSLVHISTGDLFRGNIRKGTTLGKKAKHFMDAGDLVPDEIVIGMVEDKIRENLQAKGFIFDGFPRTIQQAESLDNMLEKYNLSISIMLALEVSKDVLKARIVERAKVSARVDDQDESKIDHRIDVYEKETSPVSQYYKKQLKHVAIDGMGTIEEISEEIRKKIVAL